MENTNNIPTAYEGKEPYIFVSYAHKDSEKVVPVVRALKDAGFRVWYDEGLVQGENYHEDIAEHIALCTTALVFLSSASANSTYCKMEIEYAFSCGKKLSVVYLEENVALSPGIQLLLNSIQSLMYGDYGSQEDFTQALFQTPCLQICAEKDSLYFSPNEKSTPKKKIVVSPLHEHVYTSEIVAATCIARGYTVHKCTCGYEYKDTYTSLAGHKYALTLTKEPACTELGCTKEVCTVCGEKKVTEIPAKGHTFGKWIVKTSPTCTLAGKKVRQCSECGCVEEETLASKGHQWSPTEQRIDEHGNKEYVSFCKLCGEEKVSKETEEQRKAREAKLQLAQNKCKSAILSGLMGIFFFIVMIVAFVEEAIGLGVISLLIVFVCGGASASFTKEYIEFKPPVSEEERRERKKKLALILTLIIVFVVLAISISIIAKRNNPKEQFEYSKYWWRNEHITIKGIKNESYAIKNETVEIPSSIDGMPVGLGSRVFEGNSFTTLILPKNLQEIFSDSLDGCSGLKNIVYKGSISDWNKIDGADDIDISKYNFTHEGECQYTEWTTPSNYNCEAGGTSTRSCEYCKKTDSKNIDPTGHNEVAISAVPAKCESTGLSEGKKCSVCNKILQEQTTVEKLGHTEIIDEAESSSCTKTGLTQGSHCDVCKKTIIEQITVSKVSHDYVEGYCSVCSAREPSDGLSFAIEGEGYTVSHIGTCTDSVIVIPDEYNGKPVISIGQNAFKGCSAVEIIIPNSVTTICLRAFAYCTNITNFTIPDGVTTLEEYVFQGCSNLQSLTIGMGVKKVGSFCFYDCHKLTKVNIKDVGAWCNIEFGYVVGNPLHYDQHIANRQTQLYLNGQLITELVIPETVVTIKHEIFEGCDNIESVTISEGVQEIESEAFMGCSNIRVLNLPQSIVKLNYRCFAYLNLAEINFAGTREHWNSLLKSTDALQSSSIGVVHCSDGDIAY